MGSSKGGDKVKTPKIDPQQLIQQAIAANRVNQVTPWGSQSYNGNTLTTQLSPEMQALFASQMAKASGPANQYALPGQNATILNGLNTRLDQRYGMGLPPPVVPNGGTPGAGGGAAPGNPLPLPPAPVQAPPAAQAPVQAPQAPPAYQAPPAAAPAASGGKYVNTGGTSSGVGGACVVVDSWLPYDTRADQVEIGDVFPVHLPEVGFHKWRVETVGAPQHVHCVEIKTKGGAVLRVSMTTPFTLPSATKDLQDGHWRMAADMKDESVFVLTPAGTIEDQVESVTEIGKEWVQPISFGGRSFPAGDTPSALIYSHNIMKAPDSFNFAGPAVIGDAWSTGSSAMNNWDGGGGGGGSYSGPGGYLGSGSYAGMGQGLAAANGMQNQAPSYSTQPNYSFAPSYSGGSSDIGAIGNSGFGLPSAPSGFDSNVPILAPATFSPTTPSYNWMQKLAAAIVPGKQVAGAGSGQWIRGVAQGATGWPIATGYDIYQNVKNK